MGDDENVSITAGIWGFIILFALALACWVLFRGMTKRIRRVRWAAQEEEERAAGQNEGSASADGVDDRRAVEQYAEQTGESERQAAIELDEERLEDAGDLQDASGRKDGGDVDGGRDAGPR